ncbi:hypothetical protein [Pseudooceanicola nanhaiensis]|uniref:hypothetical protein n=1 Tax=Pseudooceanicola nanhaiensis TaxID=375761 RepID=UPI001CD593B9|nr:hypothetical protein [Pseudooceanicola nanhaiensis]MCA0919302.1 hypothetical protein [Pseudooceanicola nanhaiensis]
MRHDPKFPNRRLVLAALGAFCTTRVEAGVDWKTDTPPVTDREVEAVLAALRKLEAAARQQGLPATAGADSYLRDAVPAFIAAHGIAVDLPADTDRILTAYDAVRLGVVNRQGRWSPGAGFDDWSDRLHINDAPVIAPHMDAFQALARVFTEGGR